jgi:hypothetical protein
MVSERRIKILDHAVNDDSMVGMEIARRWAGCAVPRVEEATD